LSAAELRQTGMGSQPQSAVLIFREWVRGAKGRAM
jgi:hypothetical protein